MPANPLTQWDDNDAALLRNFLDKCPRFLPTLQSKRPRVTANQSMEARAMSGSEVKGAEDLLAAIDQMAAGPSVTQSPFIGPEAP